MKKKPCIYPLFNFKVGICEVGIGFKQQGFELESNQIVLELEISNGCIRGKLVAKPATRTHSSIIF